MRFNIIGAGKLGKNIAYALSAAGITSLEAVCNRSSESAARAVAELKAGKAMQTISQLPMADMTWITCNDDAIESVVAELLTYPVLKPGSIVVHCSGVLSSSLLQPLKVLECSVASFHPLKAFRAGYLANDAFNNVDCIMEGDERACSWIRTHFADLGAFVSTISPEAKAPYHAAACIASNYLVTLAACSEQLFLKAGLNAEQTRRIVSNLMQGSITNLKESATIAKSLTGPLMRGDLATLSRHLEVLNPVMKTLYKAAGLATISLTQLSDENKAKIEELLTI